MRQKLFSYLLAAAALIGCTREPETQPEVYDQETEYEVVLTASLAPDTRGVTVTSDAVTATWSADDKVALVYNNKILTALEVTGISGNTAQLSGKVYGAYPTNTAMTLYYGGVSDDFTGIRYDYSGQDGTAEEAAKRAYLQANVKIAKQENKKLTLGDAQTGGAITLAHQQAYYELKFQYGPDVLKVRSVEVTEKAPGEQPKSKIVKTRSLTPNGFQGSDYEGSAADHFTVTTVGDNVSTVYFVFSDVAEPTSDGFEYRFKITDIDGNEYVAEWMLDDNNIAVKDTLDKRGPAENGTYKSGTWVLDRQTLDPTKPQAQSVVYDAQPHELVTPGSLPYGNGSAEGAKMLYYVAPVIPVGEAIDTTNWSQNVTDADWSEEVPTKVEPGQYCIWYKVVGGRLFKDIPPTPVVSYDPATAAIAKNSALIDKRSLTVTAPTGIANLKYTGSAQALINPGTIKDKTSEEFDPGLVMQYCVDSVAIGGTALSALPANPVWSTDVPSFTNAYDYYIWYKVEGSDHYYGLDVTMLSAPVTIQTTDAVIANPEPIVNLIYNGEYQQLVLPADASDGCKVYYYVATSNLTREQVVALGDDIWVAPADLTDPTTDLYKEFVPAPKKRDAGTYYVWTKVVDESGGNNYSGVPGISEAAVVARITPISITVTDYPAAGWTYDGATHPLMTAWMTVTFKSKTSDTDNALDEPTPAVLWYKLPGGSWTQFDPENVPAIPERTDAASYTVSYYVVGDTNFENFRSQANPATFTVTAAPTYLYVTLPAYVTADLTYTPGVLQRLLDDGAVMQYQRGTDMIDAGDQARIDYKWTATKISGAAAAPSSEPLTLPNVKAENAGVYTAHYKVYRSANFVQDKIYLNNVLTNNSFSEGYIAYGTTKTIQKANPAVTTAPVGATNLVYDGTAQDLLSTAGAVTPSCTLEYKVTAANHNGTDINWTSTAPKETNADNYTVEFRIVENDNYNPKTDISSIVVPIAKADPTLTAQPTKAAADNLVYNGYPRALITAAATYTGGTASSYVISDTEPAVEDAAGWVGSASISTSDNLKRTNAGTYKVWTRITGDDNHNTYVWPTPLEVEITKGTLTYTAPNAISLEYDPDHAQNLVTAGTAPFGYTMEYSRDQSSWSSSVPQVAAGTAAGTDLGVVYYRIQGGNNYNSVSGSVNIPNMAQAYLKITIVSNDPRCSWSDNNHHCDITLASSDADGFDLIFRVSPKPSDVDLQNGPDDGVQNQFYGFTPEWGDEYVQCKAQVSKPWSSVPEPKSKSFTYTFTSSNSNYANTTLTIVLTQNS